MEQALRRPEVIGFNWFTLYDQPVTGRTVDAAGLWGEACNFGLVNQADQPYQEVIPFIQATNARAYALHLGQTPPVTPADIQLTLPKAPVVGPVPRALATWGELPVKPAMIRADTWQSGADAQSVEASFAVAGSEEEVQVRIDVLDPELHVVDTPGGYWEGDSVQIGIGTELGGKDGSQVQFMAALTPTGPVLWKDIEPDFPGPLPSGCTIAGQAITLSGTTITRMPGGMRYDLRIPAAELKPLCLDRTQPLRLSLLVNSNRGHGRAGWVEWGSGIGLGRNPALYGTLEWR